MSVHGEHSAAGKYFTISAEAGLDKRLSFQARGIVYFVLSNAPGQTFTIKWLETQAPNGRESISAALRELETFGYLTRRRQKNEHGRWEWDQVITDALPEPTTAEIGVFPQVAPCYGFPYDGLPSHKYFNRPPLPVSDLRAPGATRHGSPQPQDQERANGRESAGSPRDSLQAANGNGLTRARTDLRGTAGPTFQVAS